MYMQDFPVGREGPDLVHINPAVPFLPRPRCWAARETGVGS